jgi:hypothetical protein
MSRAGQGRLSRTFLLTVKPAAEVVPMDVEKSWSHRVELRREIEETQECLLEERSQVGATQRQLLDPHETRPHERGATQSLGAPLA